MNRLATLMFSAAVDAKGWRGVLAALSAEAGDVPVHLIGLDRAGRLNLGHVEHGYHPETVRLFAEHYHDQSPWMGNVMAEPVGRALPCALMCPDREVERTAFYADVVRPHGDLIGGGGAVLARTPTTVVKIGGSVPRRHRDRLEPRLIDVLNLVIDPLGHAWNLGRTLAAARLELTGLNGHVQGRTALFVLSAAGGIAHANAEGAALLASGETVQADLRGRLRFPSGPAQARLSAALAGLRGGALPMAEFTVAGSAVRLAGIAPDVLGDGPAGLLLGAGRPCLMVVVTQPAARPDRIAHMMSLHGLTRAEAEVACALAEGLTPAEIATARGASLHTVRNQIKAALGKCGVQRHAGLVTFALSARRD
jgi:DNA-binding CsgD family transcriptional regulator